MRLKPNDLSYLQETYNYLVDLGEDEPPSIDPVTWKSPEDDRLIHIAAMHGNLAAVGMLVDAGEDVNVIGDMGDTPAHYAASFGHRKVFDFLMERGADATIINEFGRTPPQSLEGFEKSDRSRPRMRKWDIR